MIHSKRVYEVSQNSDGFRVLVDRLWPRGMSKEKAQIDLWMKEVAPSDTLRKWFGHDPKKWEEFEKRYKEELQGKQDMIAQLRQLHKEHGTLTLLYGAKDTEHNQAVVLAKVLTR